MSEFIEQLKPLLGKDRQEQTVKKIISNITTVYKNLGYTGQIVNLDFLLNADAVERVMSKYTTRSYKTYIGSIVSVLTVLNKHEMLEMYKKKLKILKDKIDKEDDSNIATEKQADRMISYKELVRVRDEMGAKVSHITKATNQEYQDVQAYMLLSIVTMCDKVMRNQELCKMVIVSTSKDITTKDKNYFVYNENKMYIYVYKTVKQYGLMIINLTDALSKILKDSLSKRPGNELLGQSLFVAPGGGPLMVTGGLQRLYAKAGLDITPTIVRNILATHRSGTVINDVRKAMKNAQDFGHSITQHLRYVRFS